MVHDMKAHYRYTLISIIVEQDDSRVVISYSGLLYLFL